MPIKNEGIEVHEVKSKYFSRKYILIERKKRNLIELSIKEYFLWEKIDGVKNIAQLKQDYYQKFKVLPTEEIINSVRSWLSENLLNNQGYAYVDSEQKQKIFGVIGCRISVAFLRQSVGLLFRFVNWKFWPVILLSLSILLFGATISQGKLTWVLEPYLNQPNVFESILFSFIFYYLILVIKVFIKLGFLSKGSQYIGDHISVGLFFVIPYLHLNRKGYQLKPLEKNIYNDLFCLVFPLFLSGLSFGLLATFPEVIDRDLHNLILLISWVGIIDFIMNACPFFDSSLVHVFNNLSGGFSIKNLLKEYMKDKKYFKLEYSIKLEKLIQAFIVNIFLWVVFGSSYILFLFSRLAEGVADELKNHSTYTLETIGRIQMGMYTPIFIIFILLFWKLLQPIVQQIVQNKVWKKPSGALIGFSLLSILFAVIYFLLPDIVAKVYIAFVIIYFMKKRLIGIQRASAFLRIHFLLWVVTVFVAVIYLMRPSQELVSYALCIIWGGWSIYTLVQFSPRSQTWIIKSVLTCCLCIVALFAMGYLVVGFFHIGMISLIGAGVCLSMYINFYGGDVSHHFLIVFFSQLMCTVGIILPVSPYGEVFLVASLVSSAFFPISIESSIKHILDNATGNLLMFDDEEKKSVESTISNFITVCLGKGCVTVYMKDQSNNPTFLREYERWLLRWMEKEDVIRVIRLGLSSVSWGSRKEWAKRVGVCEKSILEGEVEYSLDKRMQLLRTQLYFRGFTSEELSFLADSFELHEYKQDETILNQGDEIHRYLEIMVSGEAIIQRIDNQQRIKVLAEIGKGDSIRSEDLLKDQVYDFSVVCVKKVMTVRLYREHFMKWSKNDKDKYLNVLESVNLAKMITKLSLFRDFSVAQVRLLMEKLKKIEIKKGDTIIQQGEEGDQFYLLDRGEVEVIANGNKVATLGVGSYFGEIALIEKCKRTASIVASKSSTVYSLAQRDFDRFFAEGRGAQVLQNVSQLRGAGQ